MCPGVSMKSSISAALTTAITRANSRFVSSQIWNTSCWPPRALRCSSRPTMSVVETSGKGSTSERASASESAAETAGLGSAGTRMPIEDGHDEERERRGTEEPPDDDRGQRPLDVGPEARRQRGRQEAEDGDDRGHEDRPQAFQGAFHDRLFESHALHAQASKSSGP